MRLFGRKKKKENSKVLDMSRIPAHIAFICDGNGRWATRRGLPRFEGHKAGVDALKKVIKRCSELGVKVTSFYCFSTENFSRPEAEVNYLFGLFRKLKEFSSECVKNGIKIRVMGDTELFPSDMQDILSEIEEKTQECEKIIVNLGLGYGGRREIVSAVNKILETGAKSVSEEEFSKYLYTGELADPDLIVRASGEQRLSNFMLFQAAYSEFYFPEVHWPDFDEKMVDECVIAYQSRNRRFGKV